VRTMAPKSSLEPSDTLAHHRTTTAQRGIAKWLMSALGQNGGANLQCPLYLRKRKFAHSWKQTRWSPDRPKAT
jgi:hypothetical protein